MTRLFYTFLFTIMISACSASEKKVDAVVTATYESCSDKSNCIIDFKDAMDFDWQVMHILSESVEDSVVDSVIGFDYKKTKGNKRLILFVKNDKVIYEQSDVWGFNDEKNPIVGSGGKSHVGMDQESAKFKITKSTRIYSLKKIN